MSNPGKEEASRILETAVRGRTIAIPEQYDGSSDWDEWLEHFEDAAAVNGWSEAEKLKWFPLSLGQKARSTFCQLPPPTRSSYRSCVLDKVAQRPTSEELDKLRVLLTDFADVFSTYDGDIGRTTWAEHYINKGDAQPIRLCPRRIPWHFREQMDGLLTDMINKDIIEPSTSPWTAPVVLVKKKDGNIVQCTSDVPASDGLDADWHQMEKMFSVLRRRSDLWENIPGAFQQSGRNPSKTEIVASWPTPTSTSEVRNFLRLAIYYRRFVKSFASIARPLHRLTEQGRQFSWSNEAEEAFQRLKRALTTAPILAFPRFDIPFVIDTDASETGIGAVLSQKHDPEGERVIAYASRTLSKTDWKYSTTRKELLSIVYFTKLFRPYLVGQRFTLRTDHDSLTWLRNFKEPEGQVARWLEHLQDYDMEVVHRRGWKHNNADAMFRRPEVTEDNGDHPTTEMPSAVVGTAAVSLASNKGAEPLKAPQDENIECVIRFLRRGRRPTDSEWRELHKDSRDLVKQWKHLRLTPAGLAVVVTGKPARWVPPNYARPSILEQLHNGIGDGHIGVKQTAEKAHATFGELNGENYSRWKFEIEAVLEARDCLDVVSGETTCPQKDENVEVFNGKQWIASVLNDVLYVPEFGSSCLFSLGAAAARGYKIIMDNFNIRLMMNNRTELVGYKDGDLYTLLIRRLSDNTSMSAMLTEGETHSFELWHQRLGHISVEKIKTMMQRKLVDGLRATAEEKFFCEGCVFGSMTRKPHKEVTERRQSVPGEIIHADVCGPFIHPSVGGNRYFICFKDESSGYRKVYFMKTKDEVLRCLKIALTEIKQETGRDVQRIRTDRGTEFANRELDNFLTEKKIVHEKTPPYTPQCNGMAERENRTLVEKARAMLHTRNLPRCLWAEAVHTAAYLLNRIPNRKEITKTPYEEWFGRRPTVEHLRIFGCDAYVHIPDQHRRKFDPKARKVIFVGYGPSNKMFRVFDTNKHRVDEVTDVQFNESLQKRLVLIDGEEDSWMQTADKDEDDFLEDDITDDKTEKRGPGRPPGSKNKIK
ncbi:Retrovirus-related Pol polyprotein from transposon TNT 1-94, partial [Trichinella patagoniensis]